MCKLRNFVVFNLYNVHASADRLRILLKSAGHCDSDTFQIFCDIVDRSDICSKFIKQLPAKPAVGLPLASDFNETVALDLHQLDKNL